MTGRAPATRGVSPRPGGSDDRPPEGGHVHHRGPIARAILGVVRAYQWLRAGRPSPCRFWPSCSAYAVEAVERHGALKGSWLAARRLSRCRPWGGSGFDPVPD